RRPRQVVSIMRVLCSRGTSLDIAPTKVLTAIWRGGVAAAAAAVLSQALRPGFSPPAGSVRPKAPTLYKGRVVLPGKQGHLSRAGTKFSAAAEAQTGGRRKSMGIGHPPGIMRATHYSSRLLPPFPPKQHEESTSFSGV